MTPSQILRKAKALIDTPEKWTQHTLARNANEEQLEYDSPLACKFCSVGAMEKTAIDPNVFYGAMYYLGRVTSNSIAIFNDTHTHAEVMQKWDEAIALAEADEKEGVR